MQFASDQSNFTISTVGLMTIKQNNFINNQE